MLRWIIDKIAEIEQIELGDYEISWTTREAVDEVGKQELLEKKLANLETLTNIGVKFDVAAKMTELQLSESDLDMDLIEQKREAMNNLFNAGQEQITNGNESASSEEATIEEEEEDQPATTS